MNKCKTIFGNYILLLGYLTPKPQIYLFTSEKLATSVDMDSCQAL